MSIEQIAMRASRQPLIRPESYGFFDKLLFAVFVLALPPVVASNWSVFRDGDVSWHVAAGRWILEHGQVPRADPFSFTMIGKPWIAFEWASEVVYAGAYNAAGFAGLAATVTLALMALFGVLFWYLRDKVGPVALLVAFGGAYLVLQPFIMARPHVLAWPFLAFWTALMLRYRDAGRAPPFAWALFIFIWANFHGSYFAGFIVSAAVALDAWIAAKFDRRTFVRWLLFGFAILIAALLNANGIKGVLYPLEISGMGTLQNIGEWRASSTNNAPQFFLVLTLVIGALLKKRPQFLIGELLLLLLTLGMAFLHFRHQSIFIILATLIVTPKLAGSRRALAAPTFKPRLQGIWLTAAAVAMLGVVVGRAVVPLIPKDSSGMPRDLIAHVPPELRSRPVFNEYIMGGPLILNGIRPFIDGRSDMYGDAYFVDYLEITDGDWLAFDRAVRKYGIDWTILENENRLVKELDASNEWKRVYSDKIGVIHVRRAAVERPMKSAVH